MKDIINLIKGETIHQFDRSLLVKGTTRNGRVIPAGGIILNNGILAGYIQNVPVTSKPKWRIIGKIQNQMQIPLINNQLSYPQSGGAAEEIAPPVVSLKSAVQALRHYYRTNFN